jgi:TRAP-type C4-dicarboxylate transport system permease small subunit
MAVTILWIMLAAAILWEVVCRRSGGRWTSLADLGARLGGRLPGVLVLIAIWAFVGWHVFARYTLPS